MAQQRREVVAPIEESHDLKRQDSSVRLLALAPPPNPEGGALAMKELRLKELRLKEPRLKELKELSMTCRTHWRRYSGSCPRPCTQPPSLGWQSWCTNQR